MGVMEVTVDPAEDWSASRGAVSATQFAKQLIAAALGVLNAGNVALPSSSAPEPRFRPLLVQRVLLLRANWQPSHESEDFADVRLLGRLHLGHPGTDDDCEPFERRFDCCEGGRVA